MLQNLREADYSSDVAYSTTCMIYVRKSSFTGSLPAECLQESKCEQNTQPPVFNSTNGYTFSFQKAILRNDLKRETAILSRTSFDAS